MEDEKCSRIANLEQRGKRIVQIEVPISLIEQIDARASEENRGGRSGLVREACKLYLAKGSDKECA